MLQQSKPITTEGWDNLSTSPYAVDEDGVFYTETSNHVGGTLNHCSFLSGRPVMCAGNIGITNGVIGYIDNGSGHYRPTTQNLLKCLKALKDQDGLKRYYKNDQAILQWLIRRMPTPSADFQRARVVTM